MTTEEYNAWAQEQNRKPGQHADYYLSEATPSGGTKSVRDPYYSSSEYVNSADSPYGEAPSEASLKWSSGAPNDIMYGAGGMWSPLTENVLLNDPNMLNAFNSQLNTGGAAQGAYTAFNEGMSEEGKAALAGLSGSSHSLAPEMLAKMWSPENLPKV